MELEGEGAAVSSLPIYYTSTSRPVFRQAKIIPRYHSPQYFRPRSGILSLIDRGGQSGIATFSLIRAIAAAGIVLVGHDDAIEICHLAIDSEQNSFSASAKTLPDFLADGPGVGGRRAIKSAVWIIPARLLAAPGHG